MALRAADSLLLQNGDRKGADSSPVLRRLLAVLFCAPKARSPLPCIAVAAGNSTESTEWANLLGRNSRGARTPAKGAARAGAPS